MNKINSFAFITAIVLTSSTGFGQTSYGSAQSSEAHVNKMRSQAYSRLANMGVEMPQASQHSLRNQTANTAEPYETFPIPSHSLHMASPGPQCNFQLWNPLTWFSGEETINRGATQTTHSEHSSAAAVSQAHSSSSSIANGSASVSVGGNGSRSSAVSNVNGWVSVETSVLVDGKIQKSQLQGTEADILNQLNKVPNEVRPQILEALGR